MIYLEADTTNDYRVLRAMKNRFGSVNELGIFEMTGAGFKEMINPLLVFVETGLEDISGSVLSAVMEGTRPFIVNVQALATKTVFGYPQRRASGFDLNRLQVLAAVLTKKAKINLAAVDVVLNIVGGLKLNDPAMDLAVCLAIISSLLNKVIDNKTIVLGRSAWAGSALGAETGRTPERSGKARLRRTGTSCANIPLVSSPISAAGITPRVTKFRGSSQ